MNGPARAEGVRMEDADGNSYLDFISSAGVTNTGYRHPEIEAASRRALDANWTMMRCCYPSELTVQLAERLCALRPGEFEKAWFGTTGSDANDCLGKPVPLARRAAGNARRLHDI